MLSFPDWRTRRHDLLLENKNQHKPKGQDNSAPLPAVGGPTAQEAATDCRRRELRHTQNKTQAGLHQFTAEGGTGVCFFACWTCAGTSHVSLHFEERPSLLWPKPFGTNTEAKIVRRALTVHKILFICSRVVCVWVRVCFWDRMRAAGMLVNNEIYRGRIPRYTEYIYIYIYIRYFIYFWMLNVW